MVVKKVENNFSEKINAQLSSAMDELTRQQLNFVPWPAYPYKPKVDFAIAYSPDSVFLKYFVDEKNIRSVNSIINSSVWEDSCVEFFISFDDEGYYNFEFNCIGTALVGFGKEKTNRDLLDVELIKEIKFHPGLTKTETGFHWELTVVIPLQIFIYHQPLLLQGKKVKANFYKCGDLLPEPHFISWANIESTEPNFHLPEFFGTLIFE